jgi:hypothetical protein
MTFEKKLISVVTYSEETEDFLRIGLIHYSEKSFAFSINYMDGYTKDNLSQKQKEYMTQVKDFFSKPNPLLPKDPEYETEHLGGTGNTKLSIDGTIFFGYVFSIQTGQKALDWFATRSALLPTKSSLKKQNKDITEEELDVYSKKTKEDLYTALGVPEERVASKFQRKPYYTSAGPSFESIGKTSSFKNREEASSSKTKEERPRSPLMGIPKSTKAKKPTVKEAIEVILDAILDQTIDEDFIFTKEYEAEEGEEKRIGYATMSKSAIVKKFKEQYDVSKQQLSEIAGPSIFFLVKDKVEEEEKE